MMDGSNKRGRPHREWSDDIEQWCGATLQELSHAALERQRWAAIVTMASDTNGIEPTVVDDDDDECPKRRNSVIVSKVTLSLEADCARDRTQTLFHRLLAITSCSTDGVQLTLQSLGGHGRHARSRWTPGTAAAADAA